MSQICGCCQGIERVTPLPILNRPGLYALAYRVGTHSTFLETMLARIGTLYWTVAPREIDSWLLQQTDLLDPIGFAGRLRDAQDGVSQYLRGSFSDGTKKLLAEYAGCSAPSLDLTKALVSDLNKELAGPSLYDADRFAGVAITEEVRSLIQTNPVGNDLMRLNRLLVEAAYESALASIESYYPLQNLTTRATSDPSIALLDAWATVGDVLTFYEERIANEGYLRTATERNSILQLARLVGYRLRPGVAASTFLAFTMEKGHDAVIPQGTRAQSLPGPGQLPQPFETSANLEARARWNDLAPRLTVPMYITEKMIATTVPFDTYFEGVATNLKPGDSLLFVFTGPGGQVYRRVDTVEPQPLHSRTLVTLQAVPTGVAPAVAHAEAIMDIANRHLQLDKFQVSPNSGTAKRVTSFLKRESEKVGKLKKEASGLSRPADYLSQLIQLIGIVRDQVLPFIEEEHDDAMKGKHAQLEQWLGHLMDELRAASGDLEVALSSLQSRTAAQMGALADTPRGIEGKGFGSLLSKLQLAPSVPPANPLRLDRTVRQTYEVDGVLGQHRRDITVGLLPDIGAQLVLALKSTLRDTLYTAFANARVSGDSALLSANALRVKAAPFGHNAPLKPILDGKGIVVGHEEWPLAGVVSIRLDFSNNTGEKATITVTQDGVAQTIVMSPIPEAEPFTFQNGWKLTVSRPNAQSPKTTYKFEAPTGWTKTISITTEFDQGNLKVTVNSHQEQTVGNLHTLQYSVGDQKITISNQDDSSFVLDETFLPPSEVLTKVLALDAQYDLIIPGSWVALDLGTQAPPLIREVLSVRTVSKADYGITGTVTELTFTSPWILPGWPDKYNNSLAAFRNVTVYAQSESLALAEEPIDEDIFGDTIELDGLYPELKSGRWVIVSGERTDIPGTSGVMASELLMLAKSTQGLRRVPLNGAGLINLPGDQVHTTIQLAQGGLSFRYKRETVTVYGNVVNATHGETRTEVLGSGDGSKILQQFALRQSPVTYTAAPTPAGAASSLQTRVNDILWHEAETQAELGPKDRKYVTKTDDADKTTVIAGNGIFGARLPTGAENVKALYRTSIGKPGNVNARQISLLATKPFGVKAVINPLAATGGADRDTRDQARRNVPIAILALDRLISVQDYADFCRSYAGIGKASSTRLSDGRRQLVEVTIAGNDDIPIDKTSDLYRNLVSALRDFGDPYESFQLDLRELSLIVISAKVRILPDYLWEAVEPKIRQKLLDEFGFDRRELGQDVLLSEVISSIQGVDGVAYVDVDVLSVISEAIATVPDDLESELNALANAASQVPPSRISMKMARTEGGVTKPAQIAYLTPAVPDTLILKELNP